MLTSCLRVLLLKRAIMFESCSVVLAVGYDDDIARFSAIVSFSIYGHGLEVISYFIILYIIISSTHQQT